MAAKKSTKKGGEDAAAKEPAAKEAPAKAAPAAKKTFAAAEAPPAPGGNVRLFLRELVGSFLFTGIVLAVPGCVFTRLAPDSIWPWVWLRGGSVVVVLPFTTPLFGDLALGSSYVALCFAKGTMRVAEGANRCVASFLGNALVIFALSRCVATEHHGAMFPGPATPGHLGPLQARFLAHVAMHVGVLAALAVLKRAGAPPWFAACGSSANWYIATRFSGFGTDVPYRLAAAALGWPGAPSAWWPDLAANLLGPFVAGLIIVLLVEPPAAFKAKNA